MKKLEEIVVLILCCSKFYFLGWRYFSNLDIMVWFE